MEKSVKLISHASPAQVGDGFFIRRPMPSGGIQLGDLSPFLLLDHAGPTKFNPTIKPRGVDAHPHKGFETVTIVFEGELEHRDSAGNSGSISKGDVQWMTAGAGIVHEEKHSQNFTEQGGILEMIQLWVNLPAASKLTPPKYQEIQATDIPVVELADGSIIRVIAGNFAGETGAASTFTPMNLFDIRAKANSEIEIITETGDNAGLYVLQGKVTLTDGQTINEAEMALFDKEGSQIRFTATEESKILFLSGTPIDEPIASYGPFVMNKSEEIQQAIQEYHTGKMGRL